MEFREARAKLRPYTGAIIDAVAVCLKDALPPKEKKPALTRLLVSGAEAIDAVAWEEAGDALGALTEGDVVRVIAEQGVRKSPKNGQYYPQLRVSAVRNDIADFEREDFKGDDTSEKAAQTLKDDLGAEEVPF